MLPRQSDFDELGLKVRRAQRAIEQIRGVGTVKGIRVVVDAAGQLLSVTTPDERAILAAYEAAVANMRPQVEEATRELRSDSRFEAISTFTGAKEAPLEVERHEQRVYEDDDDDDYYEQRNRNGWF